MKIIILIAIMGLASGVQIRDPNDPEDKENDPEQSLLHHALTGHCSQTTEKGKKGVESVVFECDKDEAE